jgi:uncharacterized cupin superfamily protein
VVRATRRTRNDSTMPARILDVTTRHPAEAVFWASIVSLLPRRYRSVR